MRVAVRNQVNMKDVRFRTTHPQSTSSSQLDAFVSMVNAGGEVARGLERRIKTAKALIFAERNDTVLGVAAVKIPKDGYKARVFQNAGRAELAQGFEFELGWIYVGYEYRRLGLSTLLVGAALKARGVAPIFATTRSDNAAMAHVLLRTGFARIGQPYPSKENPGSTLDLFITEP